MAHMLAAASRFEPVIVDNIGLDAEQSRERMRGDQSRLRRNNDGDDTAVRRDGDRMRGRGNAGELRGNVPPLHACCRHQWPQ